MASIQVPDPKVAIIQTFLQVWKDRNIANIDKALAQPNLDEPTRQNLLAARAEVEGKGWKLFTWEMFVAQAKAMRRAWAREDAEPQAKALINQIEADALAELSGL